MALETNPNQNRLLTSMFRIGIAVSLDTKPQVFVRKDWGLSYVLSHNSGENMRIGTPLKFF